MEGEGTELLVDVIRSATAPFSRWANRVQAESATSPIKRNREADRFIMPKAVLRPPASC